MDNTVKKVLRDVTDNLIMNGYLWHSPPTQLPLKIVTDTDQETDDVHVIVFGKDCARYLKFSLIHSISEAGLKGAEAGKQLKDNMNLISEIVDKNGKETKTPDSSDKSSKILFLK